MTLKDYLYDNMLCRCILPQYFMIVSNNKKVISSGDSCEILTQIQTNVLKEEYINSLVINEQVFEDISCCQCRRIIILTIELKVGV